MAMRTGGAELDRLVGLGVVVPAATPVLLNAKCVAISCSRRQHEYRGAEALMS